jgi:flagellin
MAITLTMGMRQNLFALKQTDALMNTTQNRLATGKKVNSALDDPISFFAAQVHLQRADDLSLRKDDMGEAIQTINAANNGIEAISDLIDAAKATAQAASASSVAADVTEMAAQFDTLLLQITALAADSDYKGVNFLDSSGSLDVYFNEDDTSSLNMTGNDTSATAGLGIAVAVSDWATGSDITDAIADLNTAKTTLATNSKELSTNLSIITARQSFTDQMVNTLTDGAANLTNADMNEESANMLMLQTRQALGTTSLSMASQAAQSVLRLF